MAEHLVEFDAHSRRAKVRLRTGMSVIHEATRRGLPGPLEAKTTGEMTALWLGPDQWLLLSDHLSAEKLIAMCATDFAGLSHHAVDVSAALSCATVHGQRAPTLLSMGASIDCSAQCIRTRFAAVPVVAHRLANSTFDLYYDRSLREYLRQWMCHSLRDPLLTETSCRSSR